MLKIRTVADNRDLMEFIKLPWSIYKGNEYWVPPLIFDVRKNLDPKRNPFFKHSEIQLFIAEKNGRFAGRIAAIKNNNHNNFHKDKAGFFGFFECENDQDVADLLLDTACQWINDKGLDKVYGPVNPSTNDEMGFLLEGFDSSPVLMMPYNPKYYLDFAEKYGLKKAKDLYAYYIPAEVIKDEKVMNKLERMAELIKKRSDVTTRFINMKDLNNEVRKIEEIYNSAWENNWGFVPLTTEEFDYMADSLKMVVDPELVIFAEVNGKPAGFSLSLPDFNQVLKKLNGRVLPFGFIKLITAKKKIDLLRVIIMGVKPEYQKRGIDSVFYLETIKNGVKNGYKGAEISWVLEDNMPMVMTAEKLGAYIYKKYRIYEKNLF
ncbi:MAG: hypothetical protein N2510_04325 [Ignavibacteria bacterium]|nr:hypothetical protein [Ignavibacteria bacterium]